MKTETQFDIEDKVWFMSNNKIVEDCIERIQITIKDKYWIFIKYFTTVHNTETPIDQIDIFATKEELIKSLLNEN